MNDQYTLRSLMVSGRVLRRAAPPPRGSRRGIHATPRAYHDTSSASPTQARSEGALTNASGVRRSIHDPTRDSSQHACLTLSLSATANLQHPLRESVTLVKLTPRRGLRAGQLIIKCNWRRGGRVGRCQSWCRIPRTLTNLIPGVTLRLQSAITVQTVTRLTTWPSDVGVGGEGVCRREEKRSRIFARQLPHNNTHLLQADPLRPTPPHRQLHHTEDPARTSAGPKPDRHSQ